MQGRPARPLQQGLGQGSAGHQPPEAVPRLADDDLGDVVAAGVGQHRVGQIVAGQHCGGPAKLSGELQRVGEPPGRGGVAHRPVRPLHMGDHPGRVDQIGQAAARAHQRGCGRIAADQHQDTLAGRPGTFDALAAHGADELVVHGLSHPAQGQFAQGGEIFRLEEVVRRLPRGLRHIDLAGGEPLAELVGGDVHHLDLVGGGKGRVRHRLAHPHAGDLPDHVDQAFQVLDVQGGPDVDPGDEQFLHVLPPLGMARAGSVGVGVFVDQQQLGLAAQRRVDVELHQLAAAVFDRAAGQHLKPAGQGLGVLAAVGLDHAHDHIDALLQAPLADGEHLVGLADAGGHAEVDLEPATPLLPRLRQQGVGIGAGRVVRGHDVLGCAAAARASRARLTASTFTCGWPMKPRKGWPVSASITACTSAARPDAGRRRSWAPAWRRWPARRRGPGRCRRWSGRRRG